MEAKVLSFHKSGNLAAVQFRTVGADTFEYISSAEAFSKQLIEVKELNEMGSVNSIVMLNHSNFFVFFMDGDILQGAKQNRVLNTSVLVAPQSKNILPVSCVEAGRWRHTSSNFGGTDYTASPGMRSSKTEQVKESLRKGQGYASKQKEIWNTVSHYAKAYRVTSATQNFSEVYEKQRSEFEKLLSNFHYDGGANGVALFKGNTIASVDVFNKSAIMQEYFPKLIRGMAMDVMNIPPPAPVIGGQIQEAEASYKTVDLLDTVEQLQSTEHQAVALGKEKRFDAAEYAGFKLDYNNVLVHLGLFAKG